MFLYMYTLASLVCLYIANMKFLFAVIASVSGAHFRHHTTHIEKPKPIVFHQIELDTEKYAPPARETGLEKINTALADLEEKESAHLKVERENLAKVKDEFLKSDLHKEAVNARMYRED